MNSKKKLKELIQNALDDIFNWNWNVNGCNVLFGEVEMPEKLKKALDELYEQE